MRKIVTILLVLFCLTACQNSKTESASGNEKYLDYCELLSSHSDFKEKSEFFDVSFDIATIEDGYRYYIIVDNPKIAMYNIEAIAIEKGNDYRLNMAANIGIYDKTYAMIPNQANIKEGFVKGFSISAISKNKTPTLYLLVQWTNSDTSITSREYLKVIIDTGEIYE